MKNPLLENTKLPQFNKIKPKHFRPAIINIINENKALLQQLLSQKEYTWNNFVLPFDIMQEHLNFVWNTIQHLNSVSNNLKIRKAYENCVQIITKYNLEIAQNDKYYHALNTIYKNQYCLKLNTTQKNIIHNKLLDFHLNGAHLSTRKKRLYIKLKEQLAFFENKFSNNIIDSSKNLSVYLNERQIKGIPKYALNSNGCYSAIKNGVNIWCFPLNEISYKILMTFADLRSVRKKVYIHYAAIASDLTINKKELDNSDIVVKILRIRKTISTLIGFKSYAEYSLATKMIDKTEKVINFLYDLIKYCLPTAKKEIDELKQFARENGILRIYSWDILYFKEKLSLKKFSISEDFIKSYFPVDNVLKGMFQIVKRLYNINIIEKNILSWHQTVRFFEIYDNKKKIIGQFYVDLYHREDKYPGAWVSECYSRHLSLNGNVQIPVAYLVCNFHPMVKNISFLNHQEIITLFHEFGHCLHHILTKMDFPYVSGLRNIPLDFSEFPSQFMEYWCWHLESMKLLINNNIKNSKSTNNFLQKLLEKRYYFSANDMLRQLRLSLIDFKIHMDFDLSKQNQLKTIISQVDKLTNLLPKSKYDRLLHKFSHIFAGEYAAGYYSYTWSEVLAADAFSKFEKYGIFNHNIGTLFLKNILEKGGSRNPIVLFKRFRHREPNINFLLLYNGIKNLKPK